MQDRNIVTTLAQIEDALDLAASFEGRAVQRIRQAGLQKELEPFLNFLLAKAEEDLMIEDSYW